MCLQEKLTGVQYEGDRCGTLAKGIADTIKNRLKALSFDRYKFIVQVYVGERREQGVRVGSRQFWDANTDNMATETFTNDHIYAVATAFAVYLY